MVILRVVGTNNCVHPKVCKKLLSLKQLGHLEPKPLTGSHRCACAYFAPRRLEYCTPEAVLSQRVFISVVQFSSNWLHVCTTN